MKAGCPARPYPPGGESGKAGQRETTWAAGTCTASRARVFTVGGVVRLRCRVESESSSSGVRVIVEWSPSRCRVESESLSNGVRVVVEWSPSRCRVESESLSGGVRVVVGWSPSRCRVESESLSCGVRVVVLDEPRRGISQTSCPPPQSLPNQRRLLTKQKATRGGGGPAESAGFALPND